MPKYLCFTLGLCLFAFGCTGQSSSPSVTSAAAKAGASAKPDAKFVLQSVARASGIDFAFRDGREGQVFAILESLGGGIGVIDYDRDGNWDLSSAGGGSFPGSNSIAGHPIGLFRNLSDWKFAPVHQAAGLNGSARYNHGIIVGDYDLDGFSDIAVTGYGGLQLWRNLGDGTFDEVQQAAKLLDDRWSSSAAWGDFNADGVPDLYVAHYVNWSFENNPHCTGPTPGSRDICPPRDFEPLPDTLYFGKGDGTFLDVTSQAGLKEGGKGLGVLVADFDVDGDTDIYVANDTTENFLYLNDGTGVFEEVALLRGVAVDDSGTPNGSMGVDLCDFNRDGLPEIWVTNYEREAFAMYRNEGDGQFLHVSQSAGITALQGLFVGFGTVCTDADLDGDEDIFVSNGHVILFPQASPRRQQPLLLENQQSRFRRVMDLADPYFRDAHEGRGMSVSDFDNDGDPDFAVSHLNDPIEVLRNETAGGNWLTLQLIGTQSNRDAIGARVEVRAGKERWHRQVRGGGSYLSTLDTRTFFGLGSVDKIDEVHVHWPSGATSILSNLSLNALHTIREPTSNAHVGHQSQPHLGT